MRDGFFLLFHLLTIAAKLIRPGGARSIITKPSTLLSFHNALKKRKYRQLYSPCGGRQPGPKGPSREVIKAIVEMKQRNPRYGCPRIAQQINLWMASRYAACSIWQHRNKVGRNISVQITILCFNIIGGKPICACLILKKSNQFHMCQCLIHL